MNDPAYRFTVIYKDGREMSQEDETGAVVKDHCHVEDWNNVKIYALRNRPGDHIVTVNFENGDFSVNDTLIKMITPDIDMFLRQKHEEKFKPLYGRRVFQGQNGQAIFFFCGWEANIAGEDIKRVLYVGENGTVWFESS